MTKTIRLVSLVSVLALAATAYAAVTVRYHNGDSTTYRFPARCSGSNYTVVFSGSTTSTVTIQGSAPCEVQTPSGKVTLSGGESLEIRNGRISIQ